jgi:hypothetical protein
MFLVIDLPAVPVLLMISLPALLRSECAAIGYALVAHPLRRIPLIRICARCLTRGHLPAAQTVGRALLLICHAVVHFIRSHRGAVVIFVIYLAAGRILFAVDLLPLLTGQLATICNSIVMNLLIDRRLGFLSTSGFARGHLSAVQPICNALILVRLALVGMVGAASAAVRFGYRMRLGILHRHLVVFVHPRCRGHARLAVIHAGKLVAILPGKMLMLHLV